MGERGEPRLSHDLTGHRVYGYRVSASLSWPDRGFFVGLPRSQAVSCFLGRVFANCFLLFFLFLFAGPEKKEKTLFPAVMLLCAAMLQKNPKWRRQIKYSTYWQQNTSYRFLLTSETGFSLTDPDDTFRNSTKYHHI